jgi:CheY-like chemotaxis protein
MSKFAEANLKPLNLVLIEDDDGDAKAVQRAFRKAKVDALISRAVDGVDALDMLRGVNGKEKISPPYILLLDLNMPRMNGIQFTKTLRADDELRRSIAFVLTTSKRDEDKLAAYDLNVAGYIVKETADEDLLSLVKLMDCYWRTVEMP